VAMERKALLNAIGHLFEGLEQKYRSFARVIEHLDRCKRDIVERIDDLRPQKGLKLALPGMQSQQEEPSFARYQVNLFIDNGNQSGAPVVYEANPTYFNVFGRIEHIIQMGSAVTNFQMIKPGALHRANGGYLVIEAMRLLSHPYAWEALKRALLTREARVESLGEMLSLVSTTTLEPEPVPLDVRVVLVGPRLVYYLLGALDEDFQALFSVVADFAETIERTPAALQSYAALLGTLVRRGKLRPLHRSAVARLAEESARSTGDARRFSAHVRDVTDLLREADYLAAEAGRDVVLASDVERAVATQIRRLDRIRELSQEAILRDHVLIDTSGTATAQVNGLSVIDAGGFAFGQPSRITATVRMGEGEVVDIEREVELGGAIHSKGVLILSSFVASRYAQGTPLSLRGTLVFEQTYGGVEGDSASLAETCALLSSLAELPLAQSVAVTGSVNQLGRVQVVGGINEKIEGFFDVCRRRGLTGEQGVLIPAENVQHLMLRDDVVEAARDGRFHVYPVRTVDEAMSFLAGVPAGERGDTGEFPDGSINRRVEDRLLAFARRRRRFSRPAKGDTGKRDGGSS
jgi:lon-related putative ATP-dependent protease